MKKINSVDKINFAEKADDDFYDWIDDSIRIACKQFRDLKSDPKTCERTLKLHSSTKSTRIAPVLNIMHTKSDADTPSSFLSVPKSWSEGWQIQLEDQKADATLEIEPVQQVPGQTAASLYIFNRKVNEALSHLSQKTRGITCMSFFNNW